MFDTFEKPGDMKQGSNNRRSRSRGGGKRHSGVGRNNFESNGPDVKIRGSAQQVQEKYLALAHDASSAGDWVSAEAFFQFAEHYYRIVNAEPKGANGKGQGQNQGQNKGQGQGQGQGQAGASARTPTPAEPQVQVSVADDSPGVAEVTDTSPAAMAAAVAERETEPAEAAKSSEAAAEDEPKKVAS